MLPMLSYTRAFPLHMIHRDMLPLGLPLFAFQRVYPIIILSTTTPSIHSFLALLVLLIRILTLRPKPTDKIHQAFFLMRFLALSNDLGIPTAAKLLSESLQSSSLILLHVLQTAQTWLPQEIVSGVLGALVDGCWRRRTLRVRRSIRQRDQLRESVRSVWALEQRCVTHLLR